MGSQQCRNFFQGEDGECGAFSGGGVLRSGDGDDALNFEGKAELMGFFKDGNGKIVPATHATVGVVVGACGVK